MDEKYFVPLAQLNIMLKTNARKAFSSESLEFGIRLSAYDTKLCGLQNSIYVFLSS